MDNNTCDRIEEVMRVSHKYRFLKIEGIFNGVSRSEFLALMLIDKTNGDKQDISKCIQAGDICKGLNCTPAAISKMLKNLEGKGWIVREVNKDNRRNTNIILTEKGHDVINDARKRINEFTKRISNRLGEDKLDQLISILEETYDIAREEINKMEEEK